MSAAPFPLEAMAAMAVLELGAAAPPGDVDHGALPEGPECCGLSDNGTPEAAASDDESLESFHSGSSDDDSSGAGSQYLEASSEIESDDSFDMSETSSDEVPDQPEQVPAAPAAGPDTEEPILTASSMSRRALRMFTGGAGAPVSSGQGSVAEPATWEALMLIDKAAIDVIDAAERGELLLTAKPLDKVDARGFLVADTHSWAELDREDAIKLGKRVQERAGAAKKEVAAKEKAAYLRERKLRLAAATNSQLEAGGTDFLF